MQNFKKVFQASILFVAVILIGSVLLIEMYLHSDLEYYQDNAYRDSLSGSLDFLIVGSCQGKYAFNPEVLDECLNCNSYNLCGIHTSPSGEIAMLSEEIDRNPVKNVVIDIDYDTLAYTTKGVHALGDLTTIPRLNSSAKRLKYFFCNVHLEDYPIMYSRFIKCGYCCLMRKALGTYKSEVSVEEKGHLSRESSDFVILEKDAPNVRQSKSLDTDIMENNDKKIEEMIRMCRDRDINVVMVMTPSTDNYVWTYSGWDTVYSQVQNIADACGVNFLDFNLYREKSSILHDENSYQGLWHLSAEGSKVFTKELTEVFKLLNDGEDVAPLFYGSYEEVLSNSRYCY